MSWPEIGGKPAAQVTYGMEEKIGLPKFSNVVTGPVSVTRFCEDTPGARRAAMEELILECEAIIADERKKVVDWMREQGVEL